MAKRSGHPGGGGQNMQQLMKQAQKMQQDMLKAQQELEGQEYTASSGGGVVTATVTGAKVVQSIKISPEVVDPDDIEMLEDLVLAAVREAMEKAENSAQEKMGKVTPNLPGMF